jgi:arginase family enzyme
MDIVELAPDKVNHYSQFTAAKLLYKMLAYVSQEAL